MRGYGRSKSQSELDSNNLINYLKEISSDRMVCPRYEVIWTSQCFESLNTLGGLSSVFFSVPHTTSPCKTTHILRIERFPFVTLNLLVPRLCIGPTSVETNPF
jgi:hypothetical protein